MSKKFQRPPRISRKNISKAGKILVSKSRDSAEYTSALELVNHWRLAHLYPINTFQSRLRSMVTDIPDAIVAQRLKRMPTIIDKLKRYPTMQLSTMQDIGGVRAIVPNVADVRRIVSDYESSKRFGHELKRKDDYIEKPKEDGYRGVHLIYKYNNTLARTEMAEACRGLYVEVQIRTQEQHIWSTAVEAMSMFLHQPFKTHGGDDDWMDFFALMASMSAISEGESVLPQHKDMTSYQIAHLVKTKAESLQALDLITGYTFATNNIHQSGGSGFYNIIELDIKTRNVSVVAYPKSAHDVAAAAYAERELQTRDDKAKDLVLVSAGELKTLRKAYPNYFLDIDKFAQRLAAIIDIVNQIG